MPPKTAMRSNIALPTGWIGAEGAVLVTRVTRLMPQRIARHRLFERAAQSCVGCFDQDRADIDAAVGDDPAMVADQLALVEPFHHFRRDPLVGGVAALSFDLVADAQRRQHLDSRP